MVENTEVSLAKPETKDDGQLPTGWHLPTCWHFTAGSFNCRTSAALKSQQRRKGGKHSPALSSQPERYCETCRTHLGEVLSFYASVPVCSWSVDCASVRQAASSVATWASFASTAAKESVPSCTRNGGSVLVATVTMAAAPFAGSPS